MGLLNFSGRKKCADITEVDKTTLSLFHLTNFFYLYVVFNVKELSSKIFMIGIFIISSLFHLSQVMKYNNPYDKQTVFLLNCDIGYAIFASMIMIIYKHKNLNSLNIIILFISIVLFQFHRKESLHNGYTYIVYHSLWHLLSSFGLYNFFNKYTINDYLK